MTLQENMSTMLDVFVALVRARHINKRNPDVHGWNSCETIYLMSIWAENFVQRKPDNVKTNLVLVRKQTYVITASLTL